MQWDADAMARFKASFLRNSSALWDLTPGNCITFHRNRVVEVQDPSISMQEKS